MWPQPYMFGKIKQQVHAAYEKMTSDEKPTNTNCYCNLFSILSPRSPYVGPGCSNYLSFTQSSLTHTQRPRVSATYAFLQLESTS